MSIKIVTDNTIWDSEKQGYVVSIPAGTVLYDGCVLSTYYDDVRIMSDVWESHCFARIWDKNEQHIKVLDMVYMHAYAEVDATPEIQEMAEAWTLGNKFGKMFREHEHRYDVRQMEINKGDAVEVVKGRKSPIGVRGEVFWIGKDSYNNTKLGIALSNVKDKLGRYSNVVWVASSNCRKLSKGMFKLNDND